MAQMSPDRLSTQIPAMLSKPYERAKSPAAAEKVLGPDTEDRPGFPTYTQYRTIEASYIKSLSPRRQPKALISQALFDRIWDVLTKSLECNESAQFRYWVRKMFKLGNVDEMDVDPDYIPSDSPQIVLIHDGLLVAVQEKLYSLLCHFHGKADHGGRDKTCSSVRQHYAWVPKDLVAQFVKACPTCKCKRRGRFGIITVSRPVKSTPSSSVIDSGTPLETSAAPSPAPCESPTKYEDFSVSSSWQCTSPHRGSQMVRFDSVPHPLLYCRDNAAAALIESSRVPSSSAGLGLQSLPMSREVSLYLGLPNGWQFHSDYATARTVCLEMKKQKLGHLGQQHSFPGRPRIPSIAPMIPPNIQELMNTYLTASQQSLQEGQCPKYIDPTLLSLQYPEELKNAHEENATGRASAQPKLNLNLADSGNGSLHALYDPNALGAFSPSGASRDSLTPELVACGPCMNTDSPFITELSTPQGESANELGDNPLFSGPKYSPLYNSVMHT
ncbi:hypothetical protein AX15_002749 [Amanita polypyramis BW_CC]|nr:hypothetical protein AX15_002749 [Amanita polypyramis BW_CC]